MTYRELIELYKQGKLEEEKCRQVEADIEKQDAISEYLFDRDEMEVIDSFNDANDDSNQMKDEESAKTSKSESKDFVKMINRSIRRAFIKMGIVVTALVVIAVLAVQFGLPKFISAHYYNPNKQIGEYTNQMSLDMAVYTELFVPGNLRDSVSVMDNGYGNYEFIVKQSYTYNGIFTDVSGKINRNKIVFYNSNIIDRPVTNIFEWSNPEIKPSGSISKQLKNMKEKYGDDGIHFEYTIPPKDAKETIKKLEKNKIYNAYVTLDKIMDYKAFVKFIKTKGDELNEIWCAPIVSNNKERVDAKNIGFNYRYGSMSSIEWDKDKYPNLQLWDEENGIQEEKLKSEDFAVSHFTDLIRYMCDQKEFVEMIYDGGIDKSMAEYVQKNGLKIYGFQAVAEKEDLQKLINAEEVYTINVEEIK